MTRVHQTIARARSALRQRLVAVRATGLMLWARIKRRFYQLRRSVASAIRATWLPLTLTAIALVVAALAPELPRPGVLSSPELLAVLLGAIAAVLATIAAIVVAVAFVALELLTEVYAAYAPQKVFSSPHLRYLVTLYLSTIALTLISLASVDSPVPSHTVGLTYFVCALTITCLIALYPAVRKVLARAKPSREEIRSLTSSISDDSLRRLSNSSRYSLTEHLSNLEGHQLFLLSEIGLRAIQVGDRITPQYIVLETGERLAKTIAKNAAGDGQELRTLINSFIAVFRLLGRASLERGDQGCARAIFQTFANTHRTLARHRAPWFSCIEFDECLRTLACEAARRGLEDASRQATSAMRVCALEHLRHNAPPEETIWQLFPIDEIEKRSDHDASNLWRYVEGEYISMLTGVHTSACKAGEFGIASSTLWELGIITTAVDRIAELGPRQRRAVINLSHGALSSMTVTQAKAEKRGPSSSVLGLGYIPLSKDLERNEPWARIGVLHLFAMARKLAMEGLVTEPVLDDLGAIGRGCVERIGTNERFGEALVLIAETLASIADDCADSSQQDRGHVLLEVEKQLDSLLRWFSSKELSSPEIEGVITGHLGHVRSLKEGLSSELIPANLEWPSVKDAVLRLTTHKASRGTE